LEVESRKFTGRSFFSNDVVFVRQKNGPISVDIYDALNNLDNKYIRISQRKKEDYPYARHCLSLIKEKKTYNLEESEMMFINSILESYLPLSIKKLKNIVYKTEPMLDIQDKEKETNQDMNGRPLDFNTISLDKDVVDLIAN
jgi:uncharacterized phage-associated protein